MPKNMLCPFFIREIEHKKQRIGVLCKGGEVRFPDKEARRAFVYPLCGSYEGGYKNCHIYKGLREKLDNNKK